MTELHEHPGGPVIGVLGGSGGVGASSFAAALAAVAGGMLVDLDPTAGGVDVLLGIEDVPGARWSGLRLDGGYLDPELLAAGLPRWGPVPVLALDADPPGPEAIGQVLGAAVAAGPVVLDLPRAGSPERDEAVRWCSLVVLVVRARVAALAAAQTLVRALPDVPVGLVACRGELAADQVAQFVGVPLLGVLGAAPGWLRRRPGRAARAPARVASGILDGIGHPAGVDG